MSNLYGTTNAPPGSSSSTTLSTAIGGEVRRVRTKQTARKSTGSRPRQLQLPKPKVSKAPKTPTPPVKPRIVAPPPLPPALQQDRVWNILTSAEEDDTMEVIGISDSEDMGDELESGVSGAPLNAATQKCERCIERGTGCTFLKAKRLPSSCDQCKGVHFKCSLGRRVTRKAKPDSAEVSPVRRGSGEGQAATRAAPEVPAPHSIPAASVYNIPLPQTPITAGLEPFVEAFLGRVEDIVRKTVREELERWNAGQKRA